MATADLIANLAEFCLLLRQSGLPTGPGDSVDALRALAQLDVRERTQVYLGLRSVLVKRVEDFPVFDAAFRTFFDGETPALLEEVRRRTAKAGDGGEEGETGREGGYTAREVLLEQDLAGLDPADRAEAARVARLIARRLALRLSRRRRAARASPRLNLRATARRAMRRGGLVLDLLRTQRRRRPANLVLLLDVSGSMELYSRFLLHFVHALQAGLRRTQSFCFATRLSPVSDELGAEAYEVALEQARVKVVGWGGGTRIGASLDEFCAEWAPGLLNARSVVIILSDGLDTGDPALVVRAMDAIHRRAGRVLWLNPLAGDHRYEPLARGMAAALPYLDLLAPGHNLVSLLALERELARLGP